MGGGISIILQFFFPKKVIMKESGKFILSGLIVLAGLAILSLVEPTDHAFGWLLMVGCVLVSAGNMMLAWRKPEFCILAAVIGLFAFFVVYYSQVSPYWGVAGALLAICGLVRAIWLFLKDIFALKKSAPTDVKNAT
jgi:predicted membrane channel-forming protein YqfA (hemolysin III family)